MGCVTFCPTEAEFELPTYSGSVLLHQGVLVYKGPTYLFGQESGFNVSIRQTQTLFHVCCVFLSDLNELNLPKTCTTEFPNPDDLLSFKLIISPDEGFYRSGKFVFSFKVGPNYPHEPPKVKCETPVYHPNIDLEGNVCLNILREDWKPVLTINSIVYGLQYLFLVSTYS